MHHRGRCPAHRRGFGRSCRSRAPCRCSVGWTTPTWPIGSTGELMCAILGLARSVLRRDEQRRTARVQHRVPSGVKSLPRHPGVKAPGPGQPFTPGRLDQKKPSPSTATSNAPPVWVSAPCAMEVLWIRSFDQEAGPPCGLRHVFGEYHSFRRNPVVARIGDVVRDHLHLAHRPVCRVNVCQLRFPCSASGLMGVIWSWK